MSALSRVCRKGLAQLHSMGRPAATIVVLRAGPGGGIQTLLLRKSQAQRFGGLWVFPGGAMDAEDAVPAGTRGGMGSFDVLATAENCAVRELREETGIMLHQPLSFISHWVPPADEVKKQGGRGFSTFFFVGALEDSALTGSVHVDGGEIVDHQFISPAEGIALHAKGELPLLPPTWMTLYSMQDYCSAGARTPQEVVAALAQAPARGFQTRASQTADGCMCFMWQGDAGWETADPNVPGARFRLIASPRPPTDTENAAVPPLPGTALGTATEAVRLAQMRLDLDIGASRRLEDN